jgi:phosphohistidine phosphatase
MGTLRLTLLRHAHAQPQQEHVEDFARELSPRGRTEAGLMGKRLLQSNLVPELILASAAQRAKSTAQLVAASAGAAAKAIQYLDELYNAPSKQIWTLATTHAGKHRHVLVCCHNPGISDLAAHLAAGTPALGRRVDLPPAGLLSVHWADGNWEALQQADATEALFWAP